MKEALYITLGWLFGLLSPKIAKAIETPHRRKNFKIAIFSDLKNLSVRLAAVSAKIEIHLGTRNKDSLRWEKTVYEKYRDDCPQDILTAMEKLLKSNDTQFRIAAALSNADENISLSLKRYSLPFIKSILEYLSIFNPEFQRNILEIREQLNILNEQIENSTFFYRLTFDPPCMKTNGDIIRSNLKNNYKEIQHRCRIIVDKICEILKN